MKTGTKLRLKRRKIKSKDKISVEKKRKIAPQQSHSLIYFAKQCTFVGHCVYTSWEISHGVACLSARRELDIYSCNRLPFRLLWMQCKIGGVLERIQRRQFRGVYYRFVDGNFSMVSAVKGISETFPYVSFERRI